MAKLNNTGGLWRNKYKTSTDKRPDFTGDITIGGVTHKIAGWQNSGAGGKPIVSLVVEQPQLLQGNKADIIVVDDAWKDDIPF